MESPYLFISDTSKDLILNILPDSNTHYQPMSLQSGPRCGVVIGSQRHTERFYLNVNKNHFQLIIKDSLLIEMCGENCPNCMREIELTKY